MLVFDAFVVSSRLPCSDGCVVAFSAGGLPPLSPRSPLGPPKDAAFAGAAVFAIAPDPDQQTPAHRELASDACLSR